MSVYTDIVKNNPGLAKGKQQPTAAEARPAKVKKKNGKKGKKK